ncbi:hypothetical protein A2634_04855 [Candidatus Amesbacteria bacterium RIFCSPHIGHO2_01_FULL_48_32]|uniref:Glycosyltransferase 2-like domain-containing protein n=1 Tax=Candidatus Amesbacteria bacterium RIFCSPLOWO2_01_FULL_48_25 TaxID=1797259 RepID=A0A1F4ZCU8_9BACT|nr:MAG: hypothetical protein A2634_04855 [Candidatus Amesbacteria bacterium RIFCSPHIGHO2_01_FULL_48_32]OGD03998.1 MAG: hypothetical protein A2989_01205 [Candidatus Amesbacteria bacterium RIFCSPLOWO2_01_FULL_48_25]HJZ05739.1 glycosyltransferase family 2 protein [Patescibacteria group bacterium]
MGTTPEISIVTPTLNSANTLEKVLQSVKRQSFPKRKIEVLIVDGGSTDNTIKIARRYRCKIIPNPKVGIMEAEQLGYLAAKGKYLVGLAPDEVLENPKSLELKYKAMKTHPQVKAVLPTGYKSPDDHHPINNYINEFGDPFSYFMYRDSKGYQYLSRNLEKKYGKFYEDQNCAVFSFINFRQLPLIELWAGGCMIDLAFVKSQLPQVQKDLHLIPLIFYLLIQKGSLLAVTKNDPTVHYSAGSIRKYLKKIRSRVEYNIFLTSMGKGGYSGRQHFDPPLMKFKKYLFVPYSFSLIFPLFDSLYLAWTRKTSIYLLHLFLCIYTSILIIYFFLIKSFNIGHSIKLYGH